MCIRDRVSATLTDLYMLAMKQNDLNRARMFAQKQSEAAHCFEMGRYYAVSCQLEPAMVAKDAETVLEIAREMLASAAEIGSFTRAPLYADMQFKPLDASIPASGRSGLRCV